MSKKVNSSNYYKIIKEHLYPVFFIFILVIIFWGRLFFPEPKLFYTPDFGQSDIWNFNYPLKDFLANSLKDLELPFWSKEIGTGFPVFAEGQVGTLYFFNLVLFYIFPTWVAWNLSYMWLFFLTMLGSYLFFQHLKLSKQASIFSAFAFSFGGYFITNVSHLNFLQAASLLPWFFLITDSLWKKATLGKFFVLGIVVSQQIFSGFLQTVFISTIGVFIYSLAQMREKSTNELIIKISIFFPALLFGLTLAAPQLVPSYELKSESIRKYPLSRNIIFEYSYSVKQLITLILPNYFGTPRDGSFPSPFVKGSSLGIYWENNTYLGILPIALFFCWIFFRKKEKWEKGFITLALLSLLLAFGKYSPLSFVHTLPFFNQFRVPSRYLILFAFSISALAARGWDGLWKRLMLHGKLHSKGFLFFPIIMAIQLVDLLNFGFNYNPLVSVEQALELPEAAQRLPFGERIYYVRAQQKLWNNIFFSKGWLDISPYLYFKNGLDANLNLLFNIENVLSYSSLTPLRQSFFMRSMNYKPFVDAAGVKYVISSKEIDDGDNFVEQLVINAPTKNLNSYYIYKNLGGLDRFRFASDYQVLRTLQDIESIFGDKELSMLNTVLLEEEIDKKFAKENEANIEVLSDEQLVQVFEIRSEKETIFVAADSYYPAWEAKLDGNPVKIMAANINQRAVIVPAGKHRLEMAFNAETFYKGLVISICSFSLFLFLVWLNSRRINVNLISNIFRIIERKIKSL